MAIGNIIPMLASAARAGHPPVIRQLLQSGATTAGTAQAFVPRYGPERQVLEELLESGVINEPSPDLFYVDEARLAASYREQMRGIRTLTAAVVIVLATVLVWLRS